MIAALTAERLIPLFRDTHNRGADKPVTSEVVGYGAADRGETLRAARAAGRCPEGLLPDDAGSRSAHPSMRRGTYRADTPIAQSPAPAKAQHPGPARRPGLFLPRPVAEIEANRRIEEPPA